MRERAEAEERKRRAAFVDTLLGETLYRNLVERNAAAEAALRGCLAAHGDDVLWSQFRREVKLNLLWDFPFILLFYSIIIYCILSSASYGNSGNMHL